MKKVMAADCACDVAGRPGSPSASEATITAVLALVIVVPPCGVDRLSQPRASRCSTAVGRLAQHSATGWCGIPPPTRAGLRHAQQQVRDALAEGRRIGKLAALGPDSVALH